MNCREDVLKFMTEWWELRVNMVSTVAAFRRLQAAYPKSFLFAYCHPREIAQGAAAMQEICEYLESLVREHPARR
jgi:hypothetical protein